MKYRNKGLPAKFLASACAYPGERCLFWPFARNSAGYGHLVLNGRDILAHRYVCEKVRGPAPSDKPMALHTCSWGHLGCVAPRHLKWGDHNENMFDMVVAARSRRGERATHVKLTAADVLAIRAATGSQEAIARRFGVTQPTISCILRGKTWAHVV
jgi:predicted XRE-type DNA-binding protein